MVFTASPPTIAAVAALLHARRVGAVVVTEGDREVVGIVSERTSCASIAEEGGPGAEAPVSPPA